MLEKFYNINFTKKYILALSLIALLSILAYINLSTLINKQGHDSSLLNISGKQRMLSQKIALFSIYYKTQALEKHTNEMQKAHEFLTSKEMSPKIHEIYYSEPIHLDQRVKAYIHHANSFFEKRDGKSLSYILENSQVLLPLLDLAVSQYQKEAEQRTYTLSQNELYIFLLTIFILICEAFFIFKPANKIIEEKTKKLKDEINFSNTITESNTNAIIAVGKNFQVIIYNKSAEQMFGYSKEEMLYKNSLYKIVGSEYLHEHNMGITNFMNTGILKHKDETLDLMAKRKNGQLFPIRISFGSNYSKESLIIVANIQDITEEKFKDSQLLQQSRYAAMGEMIGNIAHQWRQPLSAITTCASGIQLNREMNQSNAKDENAALNNINMNAQYLSQTIDDFRNFFKKDYDDSEFDLNASIRHALSLTQASYKSNNIEVVFSTDNEHITYQGKKSEISQVIMNILHNAKDVFVLNGFKEGIVKVMVSKKDDSIQIRVQDSAGGISFKIIDKIFEPYFTTKHKSQGTGIGLFMSKEIIVKHFNGELSACNEKFVHENKEYFGASFMITLPLKK